jgi:hypothetical protein
MRKWGRKGWGGSGEVLGYLGRLELKVGAVALAVNLGAEDLR